MRFYLGTHLTEWLGRKCGGPLFVSAIQLRRRKCRFRSVNEWAVDSGGFTELTTHGRWTVTPERYVRELVGWDYNIGGIRWAAAQDWMCEPFVLKKTGLTVAEHQKRTTENYLTLIGLKPPVQLVPVLQGWEVQEYISHFHQYKAAGVDLSSLPLVGVGSVCRRQGMDEAERIIRSLFDLGVKVHGFGFKLTGLRRCADVMVSADSLAWSRQARFAWDREERRLCGGGHVGGCANCIAWAEQWRSRVEGVAGGREVAA